MSPVEACPIHHKVKQLSMTLNALLASAESTFGARIRIRSITPTALTTAPVDLKMNSNHFSVSVNALNRHDYIGNSMSRGGGSLQL